MRIAPIALTACALACAVGCRTTKDVLDDYERNMKLIRFALGRGFEMQAIRQCLPDSAETDIFDF